MVAVSSFAGALLRPVAALADYGTTPALELPWTLGAARDVSGFTYGIANQTCAGVHTTHTGLEAYAIDFGLTFEPVLAAAYGTVGYEGYTSAGGYYIWVQSGNVQTYYGHLSSYSVNVGTTVYKGQQIAVSGNSGPPGTGAHLHFRATTGGTQPFNGTPYKPEPMSGLAPPGYIGWQNYGCNINTSTLFYSTPPNQQVPMTLKPATNQKDLFVRGGDGKPYHSPTNAAGQPLGWESPGGTIAGPPVGVWSQDGTQIDAYAVAMDRYVIHNTWNGGSWSGWSELPYNQQSGPSEVEQVNAARDPDGSVDLFVRDSNGWPWHAKTTADGSDASYWEILGGNLKGAPFGAWDYTRNRLDVYGVGLNDQVWHDFLVQGGTWSGWSLTNPAQAVGQAESELVTAARRTDGSLDLFIRGVNGVGYHAPTDVGGNPLFWESIGGYIKGAPNAQWNGGTLYVYAVGLCDCVYLKTWNGAWSGWILETGITG